MPSVAHIIRRRHSRKIRRNTRAKRSALWFFVIVGIPLALALTPLLAVLGISLWLYLAAASHMPTAQETVFLDRENGVTRFYDESGSRLIYSVGDPLGENRRWLKLGDLPPHLINATLMAEDSDHLAAQAPFDPSHTLIQLWRYIMGLPVKTEFGIIGNLVRDTVLPLTKSSGLDASLLEVVLVAESKRNHTAEALLEWRLNSSYYGYDAFGIEAAAQVYLGKAAKTLSLAESALLAAIVEQPERNPIDATVKARERGADLLFQMLDAELIDKAQFDEASVADVTFRKAEGRRAEIAPAFIDYARGQAEDLLERQGFDGARLVARGALRITTSLDMALQLQAECVLRAHLRRSTLLEALDGSPCEAAQGLPTLGSDASSPPDTGALTLIDVGSGRILSMVGNALAQSHQPAIALQPFVYLDAFLSREVTPASMLYDMPRSYPGAAAELIYTPANPDGVYRGPLNLRDAMAAGLIPPAVQVASAQGMAPVIRAAQALGFNSLDASRSDLELLERGGAVSVLDTAYAYSVLASMGFMRGLPVIPLGEGFRRLDPVAILKIEDPDGAVLWSYDEDGQRAKQSAILEPSLAYMVNDILADSGARQAVLQQPDSALRISHRAAVVDGLSADKRDSWTVGYTPDLALALHTGRGDDAPLGLDAYDRAGSAPVWRTLMEYAHRQRELPERDWAAPADVEEYLVCEISGLLPATTDHCPTRREMVPTGSLLQRDHLWQTFEINRSTGQLATVNTPAELREAMAYFIPPDDIMNWWVENGKPLPPNSYSTHSAAQSTKPLRLTSPADYAYVGATVDIAASINRAGAETWLLEYGAEVNPDSWFSIGQRQSVDASGEISATWETALFSGIYTLRLTVTFADGSVETDTKLLTFDNTPPAVKLRTGDGASTIRYATRNVVSLLADVSDNLTIERVEFYRNDELLGEDRAWPYGYEYALDGAGEIVFKALAFDQVGNRAASELTVSIVAG